ncbi:hypothetical protein B4923_18995 [Brenneria roseae subsp. americana]|uniref:Uncharacterized protein n=1 Tax=Brenneria roseae subsp. americana TaxID=1508507 RepID=A0A2U1TJT2_9GAMM|nr:CesT family type III secretion system chaperone [Brenneria roseae]PWC09684.1 hypothetical protein B4923_18995 [Brenneria roseae subsp. americana]
MSEPNYAKTLLLRWVEKQAEGDGTFNVEAGVQVVLNGQALFLRLPESRETLFVFMPVYMLDFERDGDLLALGMMLNLEPGLMCGAAIGLETQQRNLMLTAHQNVLSFDERALSAWIENVVSLGLRIREEFASVVAGRKTSADAKTLPLSGLNRYRAHAFHSQLSR